MSLQSCSIIGTRSWVGICLADSKKPFRKPANKGLVADSVFISDGDVWKNSRDLLKPIFKRSQIADLHTLEFHVQHALNEIPADDSTIDLQELFRRLVSSVNPVY